MWSGELRVARQGRDVSGGRQRVTEVGCQRARRSDRRDRGPGRPDRRGARAGRADRRHPREAAARGVLTSSRRPPCRPWSSRRIPRQRDGSVRRPDRARRRGPADRPAARRGATARRPCSLHGEVQKEVIAALLEERYGVRSRFLETSVGVHRARGRHRRRGRPDDLGGNPYLASIGLRVDAAPLGHGVEFSPGIERGNLPPAFVAATEEGVRAALRPGVVRLGGHRLRGDDDGVGLLRLDRASRTRSSTSRSRSVGAGLPPPRARGRDGRARAGRHQVCQPIDRFELEVPDECSARTCRCWAGGRGDRWRRPPPVATPAWSATCRPAGAEPSRPGCRTSTSGEGGARHPARPPRAGHDRGRHRRGARATTRSDRSSWFRHVLR